MAGIEGIWEFRVQLCRDLERQPVEDPTVQRDEEAPFQRVATITVRPQPLQRLCSMVRSRSART